MARIWSTGFELNSTTANVEFTAFGTGQTIQTGTVRSGTYAGKISGMTTSISCGFLYEFLSAAANGPYWGRAYFNFSTFPSAENTIMGFRAAANMGSPGPCRVSIDSSGVVRLRNTTTLIGSPSSALNLNQWYCFEIKHDGTAASGSQILELYIDQSLIASASNLTISPTNAQSLVVGGNLNAEAQTTGVWYIDDIAINNSTGSFQNTYAGQGKIIHLKPNATGDANAWPTQVGGTAGSANNYTRVNEVTPNGTTSTNASNTLNQEDFYNCDDSGIGASDTVNLVAIGVSYKAGSISSNSTFKVEVKKTSGGTVSQGTAITPNTTSFLTNSNSVPDNSTLILYQDPDSSNWTKSTLDSMQIGMKITTGNTNNAIVTTLWALVDYTPSVGSSVIPNKIIQVNQSVNRANTY